MSAVMTDRDEPLHAILEGITIAKERTAQGR
jgi:hypothetical protein